MSREISEQERADMRRWVETWKAAGPELEAIRRKEIRETDTLKALAALEDAFNHALDTLPMRGSSGLVEMQDTLSKLRPPNR
jgi:hypothetical protein